MCANMPHHSRSQNENCSVTYFYQYKKKQLRMNTVLLRTFTSAQKIQLYINFRNWIKQIYLQKDRNHPTEKKEFRACLQYQSRHKDIIRINNLRHQVWFSKWCTSLQKKISRLEQESMAERYWWNHNMPNAMFWFRRVLCVFTHPED